jgi:signal transduction histidine kinase
VVVLTEDMLRETKGHDHPLKSGALARASKLDAVDRLSLRFDLLEAISEYRALRASALRLWHNSSSDADDPDVNDITCFNESIDQSISQSVASYTRLVDQARDMFLAIVRHDLRNPPNATRKSCAYLQGFRRGPRVRASSVSVMERMYVDNFGPQALKTFPDNRAWLSPWHNQRQLVD